jgi:hypothetical protein
MKLSTRDAVAAIAKPDLNKTGVLIYGANAMRVALKRQQLIKGLIRTAGRGRNAPHTPARRRAATRRGRAE